MNFIQGSIETSYDQQMIAFMTHMIDTYATLLIHCPHMLPVLSETSNMIHEHTGTNTQQSYLGAVRAGFEKMLISLPEPAYSCIHNHLTHTISELSNKVNNKIIECDILFGYNDPFNIYYSNLRFQENHPLVMSEYKNYIT